MHYFHRKHTSTQRNTSNNNYIPIKCKWFSNTKPLGMLMKCAKHTHTHTEHTQVMRCKPYFSLAFQTETWNNKTAQKKRVYFVFPVKHVIRRINTPIQMPLVIFFSTIYATQWKCGSAISFWQTLETKEAKLTVFCSKLLFLFWTTNETFIKKAMKIITQNCRKTKRKKEANTQTPKYGNVSSGLLILPFVLFCVVFWAFFSSS